jgi:DNA replication and repair protein RecF
LRLTRVWLTDFRNHTATDLELPPGLTVVTGANGEGKTNLLEAIAWLASLQSFRGVSNEALVRDGTDQAIIRATLEGAGRHAVVEAAISRGRTRVQLNRKPLRRADDLLGQLRVTVFTPDDLVVVKGGPAERRHLLDDIAIAIHGRHRRLRTAVDRVLRQRNTLLRQSGGRLDAEGEATLAVWDAKLVAAGEELADARADVVEAIRPALRAAYTAMSASDDEVTVRYEASWRDSGLADALVAARREELRRGVSLVGPHRDDLSISLAGLPARTHASQGEQRSLALALRLAGHGMVCDVTGVEPVVLLDDVFSELDDRRAARLVRCLPAAQTVLTTATGSVPADLHPDLWLEVSGGRMVTVPTRTGAPVSPPRDDQVSDG